MKWHTNITPKVFRIVLPLSTAITLPEGTGRVDRHPVTEYQDSDVVQMLTSRPLPACWQELELSGQGQALPDPPRLNHLLRRQRPRQRPQTRHVAPGAPHP